MTYFRWRNLNDVI